jgi:hypothetical protein
MLPGPRDSSWNIRYGALSKPAKARLDYPGVIPDVTRSLAMAILSGLCCATARVPETMGIYPLTPAERGKDSPAGRVTAFPQA